MSQGPIRRWLPPTSFDPAGDISLGRADLPRVAGMEGFL
jgi:hypothetical protein